MAITLIAATRDLLRADTMRMDCLHAVAALGLDDWYIAAGFMRSMIWDRMHVFPKPTPLNDVDVTFFDPSDRTPATEHELEMLLTAMMPSVRWQPRNQARMHVHNGHLPYADTRDAIARFPELPTCIGVRLDEHGELHIDAPHGIAHSWDFAVRQNPAAGYSCTVMEDRAKQKHWLRTWPRLWMAPSGR